MAEFSKSKLTDVLNAIEPIARPDRIEIRCYAVAEDGTATQEEVTITLNLHNALDMTITGAELANAQRNQLIHALVALLAPHASPSATKP